MSAAVCAVVLIAAICGAADFGVAVQTVLAQDDEPPASPPSRDTTGGGPAPQLPPPSPGPSAPKPPGGETPVVRDQGTASTPPAPLDGDEPKAPSPAAPSEPPPSTAPSLIKPNPPVSTPAAPGTTTIAPRPPAGDDVPAAQPVTPGDATRDSHAGDDAPTPVYYALVAPEAMLTGDLKELGPSYYTIGPELYEPVGDTRYKIRPVPGQTLSETLYLRVNTTWIDPVTPPEGSRIRQPDDGTMVLTELYGDVRVRNKDRKETAFRPATEGMIVPTGTEITTSEGSSVAVVLYGLQSARVGPSTSLMLRQGVTEGRVVTDLNLVDGTVFVRVGGKEEAAAFHVRTPLGIVQANGSDFAVWYRKEKIVVCSAAGAIRLTDLGGRDLVTLDKYEPGMINIAGIPSLDLRQRAEWLYRMLTLIKRLNGKSAALIAEKAKGVALNDLEQTWLKRLHPITYYVKARLIRPGSGSANPTSAASAPAPGR